MTNEIKSQVKRLLETVPSLRDSDERLVANVWAKYCEMDISAHEFILRYSQGKIPTADAITRARRDLQKYNESLRGEMYEPRHKKEKEVRKEYGNKFKELI